ncbi:MULTISPECIES: hypothetical protein [unclassified Pseudomonas]|uniref:hypothetical protein n=1 Tax=unclassified Pseudomonas TaxID=196821 RepID=UPI003265178D
MIQIALLLFGAEFVRSRAKFIGGLGLLWGVMGAGVLIDGMDGVLYFPMKAFGILLLLESLITLSVASSGIGAQKAVLFFKGGVCFFVSLLILANKTYSNLLLAIIFGFSYFIFGLLVITSAFVVRYPHWRFSVVTGSAKVIFALLLFTPYPVGYQSTVSFFIGSLMIVSGISALRVARRASLLVRGTSSFELLTPRAPVMSLTIKSAVKPELVTVAANPPSHEPLVVHIWTPEGTAENTPVPRPIINRYIAAVDSQGVISTGHAALELQPSIYISLYPAADIDRSPSEFFRILKATRDNDVPGTFQPDYATEAADWCESDRKILFHHYNSSALEHFWMNYSLDNRYNLTYRNCSSTVAYALEASLDGALAFRSERWRDCLRTLFMPELWIAAQVRRRALTMAWTPGLVMDYARALRAVVHPVPQSWFQRMPWKARHVDTLSNDAPSGPK